MKREALSGERDSREVIQKVLENNSNIDKKTVFSRAKLHKRKESKYARLFTPHEPTARALAEYYFQLKPTTTRSMRYDTLAQMLTLGNVGPGWRGIVVDECGGLLLGAVLERMGGEGEVLAIHPGDQPAYWILGAMNDVVGGTTVHYLPWNQYKGAEELKSEEQAEAAEETKGTAADGAEEERDDAMDMDAPDDLADTEAASEVAVSVDTPAATDDAVEEASEAESTSKRQKTDEDSKGELAADNQSDNVAESKDAFLEERRKARKEAHMRARVQRREARKAALSAVLARLHAGNYVGLLAASGYHPTPLLSMLAPYMGGSSNWAIYSPTKEPLPDTYLWARGSGLPFINVQLTETFLREWQPKRGRMHPTMNTSGTGGFLLSGIKVMMAPTPPVFLDKLAQSKGPRGQKRKGDKGGAPRAGANSPAPSAGDSEAA